jgi:hypothetical protein
MDGSKVIGYVLTFSKGNSVTIYHGQNGIDGSTPQIGVKEDIDGIYYWTVNETWLLDEDGNKVKAVGTDGQNGSEGVPGTPGIDGVTPLLKIENGRWCVSYNEGETWTDIGQATGDQGPEGESGIDGDSFFRSVTVEKDYVRMLLANGTQIDVPRFPADAVTMSLGAVTGYTATFNGIVNRSSLDLKVTVYYSTNSQLTVYKNTGKTSVTEFNGNSFILKLTGLNANTRYYYFVETLCNGVTSYSEVSYLETGAPDSYVDWGDGENIGGEI